MPLNIIRQDITTMHCDAIVVPTNTEMVGYSGIDLLVHSKAGPELDAECRKLAPLELGFAKITGGYNLPCKYLIHTHGPIWTDGSRGENAILKSCYLESLKLAKQYNCQSVALPLISAGHYGFPKNRVMKRALDSIAEFLESNELTVYLCVFSREDYEFDNTLYKDIQSFIDRKLIHTYASSESDKVYAKQLKREIKAKQYCSDRHADSGMDMYAPLASSPAPTRPSASYNLKKTVVSPKASNTSLETTLNEFLKQKKTDGFSQELFRLIDERGISDIDCYKKANVDKKLFSKIKCNKNYKPSKQTAIAFAIALELNMDETNKLLASAGLALSHSSVFDIIIEYYILHRNYDIFEINEALFEFDQVLLGC